MPSLFNKYKSDFLKKTDKSKKQSIDKEIKQLVEKINSSNNYYTTSSCAGRIVLLSKSSDKKQNVKWLFKSHRNVGFKEIGRKLKKLPKNDVWFRYEAAIFHIACKTIGDAQKLVNIARSVGFKRSGIQPTKKMIVEVASSGYLDTIIAKNGKLLVSEDYIKVLIKEANKKLKKNMQKIERFYKLF